ncbi:MAG: MFS transporter [Alphaproteobacteria bacterium]|nr:MFS transporter [Alphaproteobacteria bacterium]
MRRLLHDLMALAGFGAVEEVMQHRSFRIYLVGHIPNVVGIWVVRIAIGWLAWELTGSSFWVGAVAAADALPVMLFGPVGGVMADRLDRKHIAVVTQAILTVIAVLLTVTTVSGFITIWLLFGFALARGITFSFWQPVRLALMPNLVPRAQLPTAIALNSSTFNAAQFIGPAFAAVLLTAGGPGLAFAFNIFAAAVMVWALAQVELPPRASTGGARASFLDDALAGIRYGASHPGIGPMLFLLLILGTMIRPLTELLSAVAGAVFLLEVGGFSAMASSVGIGAMVGAIWMLRRGNAGNSTDIALSAGLVGGTAALLVIAVAWFPFALLCLALLGFSMTAGGIATQQVLQFAVPDEMRGRVLGLFGMVFRAGPALGALAIGAIGDLVGLTWPILVAAAAGLGVFMLAWSRRARLRAALETPPEEAAPGAPAANRAAE